MRSRLLFTLTALLLQTSLCLAEQAVSADHELASACRKAARMIIGRNGVTRAQADLLAETYFQIYYGSCGGALRAQQHERYWSAPILVGPAGVEDGAIRVDRITGAVSHPGKPTVYPKDFPHALSREYSH